LEVSKVNTGNRYKGKHGLAKSSINNRWSGMLCRCYNVNSKKYHRYGGRGIKVCKRWHTFINFFEDMGHPPGPEYSIDRIDVNKGYSPENVRWATQKTQQNNRANNRWICVDGETKLVTEWARITGVPSKIIRQRIDRDGLSPKVAVFRRV